MTQFLHGALVMASIAVGVFFLRFWRDTKDRLFVMFALAFWILSLGWLLLAVSNSNEGSIFVYSLRLLAFLLIILAIVDKNRTPQRGAR